MPSKSSRAGQIDLRGLFQAVALRLDVAVAQGRLLHKTKNIRDSGSALEHEFKAFLGARLPSPFSARSGYLFDPSSTCTPQIDCIVVDDRESHELMRSDDGAAYIPYPAGRILIEIKHSARGFGKHVKQIDAIRMSVAAMRRASDQIRREGSKAVDPPLCALVIGDSSSAKLASFKKAFAGGSPPDISLLLDRAIIIARDTVAKEFFTSDGRDGINRPFALDNFDLRQGANWVLWTPEGHPGDSGHALLWFYFALIVELNRLGDTRGAILSFTDQVIRDFPMVQFSEINAAKKWP